MVVLVVVVAVGSGSHMYCWSHLFANILHNATLQPVLLLEAHHLHAGCIGTAAKGALGNQKNGKTPRR